MSFIGLLTDYGTRDWFAGSLKGVIVSIDPDAQIIDISHEVPRGSVRAASFILAAAYRYFPRGTVFISVVDPGVGSDRIPAIIQTREYTFVGPDNGVFSFLKHSGTITGAWKIENSALFRHPVSATFHGRDIFAPVAAFLSCGGDASETGSPLPSEKLIAVAKQVVSAGEHGIIGEIVYIDHFGNAITNIEAEHIARRMPKGRPTVNIRNAVRLPLIQCYSEAPPGQPCALLNSAGFLEIAVNGGNARMQLDLEPGTKITLDI